MLIRYVAAALMICAVSAGHASVTVGGRSFADNAFADTATFPAVSYFLWDGVTGNVDTISTDANMARAAMLDTPIGNPSLAA